MCVGLEGRCVCVCEIAFRRVVGEFMQVYEIQLFTIVRVIVSKIFQVQCSVTETEDNREDRSQRALFLQ